MDEIVALVESFLNMEYEVNTSNYSFKNRDEWEQVYKRFQDTFLMDRMNDHWFKIPVEQFTDERRESLSRRIHKRKIYLIKRYEDNKTGRWINAFCSFPDNVDNLRDCLAFNYSDEKIRLFSVDTICENCFGAGFIEESAQPCSHCFQRGFNYSNTIDLVNWKTVLYEPEYIAQSVIYNLPASDIQKKAISIQ